MSKLFTHAGVSRRYGTMKVRWATDIGRIKTLIKTDHTDIDIIELPHAMSKEDSVAYLLSIDFDVKDGASNAEVRQALEAAATKRNIAGFEQAKKPRGRPKKIVEEAAAADAENVVDITEQVAVSNRASNGRFVKKTTEAAAAMTAWAEAADAEEAEAAVA